jgi:hypothetical protein
MKKKGRETMPKPEAALIELEDRSQSVTPHQRAQHIFQEGFSAFPDREDEPEWDFDAPDIPVDHIFAAVEKAADRRGYSFRRYDMFPEGRGEAGSVSHWERTISVTTQHPYSEAAQAAIAIHEFVHCVDPKAWECQMDLRRVPEEDAIIEIQTCIATALLCEDLGLAAYRSPRCGIATTIWDFFDNDYSGRSEEQLLEMIEGWAESGSPLLVGAVTLYERASRGLSLGGLTVPEKLLTADLEEDIQRARNVRGLMLSALHQSKQTLKLQGEDMAPTATEIAAWKQSCEYAQESIDAIRELLARWDQA